MRLRWVTLVGVAMSHQYGPPQGPPPGGYPPQGPPPGYPPQGPPGGYPPPGYGFQPPLPHRRKKNRTGLKVAGGIIGGLIVLSVIGTLLQGGGQDNSGARDRLVVAGQTSSSPPTPMQEETSEEATPTSAPTPTMAKPRTYRGVGDKVLKVKETEDVLLATLTHQGSSNFIVHPIDPGGAEQASIVNEIGAYKGTVIVNEENGKVCAVSRSKLTGHGRSR
ncbi:hypothetical protein [Nonomuraea sp. 10N515B]|uniref:hypothetical protein n=1 Tax=Nonomuraea sp. 10N515B TaxID=3457422 RepID=UPI003FCCD461